MSNAPLPSPRTDALARAAALAQRSRDLRRMQVDVQKLTAHEVEVLARTAASFFDAIPLPEFTTKLLPHSERGLRRIRHRILHRTITTTATGTLIRALLLGRDGTLRMFAARSVVSRDLLLILENGRALPAGVAREVVDWTPMLRVPQFRPFEILEKLSRALDAVEERIADAEDRVSVQWAALASGDLSALLVEGDAASASKETSASKPPAVARRAAVGRRATTDVPQTEAAAASDTMAPARDGSATVAVAAADVGRAVDGAANTARDVDAALPADGRSDMALPQSERVVANAASHTATHTAEHARETVHAAEAARVNAPPRPAAPVPEVNDVFGAVGLFDMFQRVQSVADAAGRGDAAVGSPGGPMSPSAPARVDAAGPAGADDSDDWDDFEEELSSAAPHKQPESGIAAAVRALFPVMPPPR